jgi:hypothetical protein
MKDTGEPPVLRMSTRLLTDDALLAACRTDLYRGSGPGGQKRNKTSNAVRLTHLRSGLQATATESRSLALNKLHALRRLRIRLATELREPIDLLTFSPPDWFLEIRTANRIAVAHRHPLYAAVAGLVLDLFAALRASPSAVATNLGVATTTVVRFLEAEPAFWAAANQIRKSEGLNALNRHGRK